MRKSSFIIVLLFTSLLVTASPARALNITATLDDAAGSSVFAINDSLAVEQSHIDSDGNVGIGTPAPAAKLHIEGGSARVSEGRNRIDIGPGLMEISGNAPYKLRTKDNDLSIYSSASLRLGSGARENLITLNAEGLIGVGTDKPEAVFQVEGRPGPVTLQLNSNERHPKNTVFLINSDVGGEDTPILRVLANGETYADGSYSGTGADYAEWFEKGGDLEPKDLAGLNLHTGKVRRYQAGDPLISVNPVVIGNRPEGKSDEEMKKDFALVSLVGQVEIDEAQIHEKSREVLTPDGRSIGWRLADGRVLLRIEK